jgi:hypothetical protein
MTSEVFIPASQKQIDFVSDLLATRECSQEQREIYLELIRTERLTKSQASSVIDSLVNAPRRAGAVSTSPLQELLSKVPKSKYAVPNDELMASDCEDSFKGDIVFLELKEFNGSRYVRQLTGAPGGFTRSRLTAQEIKCLFALIAQDPYRYARIFGEHYTCCGSCGAELTDARSRKLMLGPECRKKFGL